MEYILKCNELKCHKQLHERAVVTTCSHIFCPQCAEATGLSQAHNGHRTCPACGTLLADPDDVVVSGLTPSEAYRTSILSGLSPTIIMECASRALAFYSYQSSQEIVFQEHLAKSLNENYTTLNRQMDQLIMEANSQIELLQKRLLAMHGEYSTLEQKNHELLQAFREKSKAKQQLQKLYQSLKAQVMATQVANAAGEEVDAALRVTRNGGHGESVPGMKKGMVDPHTNGMRQQLGPGGQHKRNQSNGSGNSAEQQRGNGISRQWGTHLRGHNIDTLNSSMRFGTPSRPNASRSRLPVFGGLRHNGLSHASVASPMQVPLTEQRIGGVGRRSDSGITFGAKPRANTTSNVLEL